MKKAFSVLLFLFIGTFLFAQQRDDNKDKKENMGQSIKEVNMYYRDKMKEIKSDPGLSKAEKKQKKRELKERKRNRIHEINSGGEKRNNKEKEDKEKIIRKEKKDTDKSKKEKKEKG